MTQPTSHESLKIALLFLIVVLLGIFVFQNTQNNQLVQTALFPKVVTNIPGDTDPGIANNPKVVTNVVIPGGDTSIIMTSGATYNASKNIVINADGSFCPDFCVNQMTGAKITLKNGDACPAPYPAGEVYNGTTKKCVKTTAR